MKVTTYNMEGKETGSIDLNDDIFNVRINEHLIYLAVKQFLANRRQGTQKAKTRAEVSGGGRKPWRQKGTGRARQGSIRSPQWKGGGVVFAPTPRDYSFKLNKKEKRAALKGAFTGKAKDGNLIVLDELSLEAIKTKDFVKIMNALPVNGKALVVTAEQDNNVAFSARNLPDVETCHADTVNVYNIMNAKTLILTKDAVSKIEEVYV